MTGAVIARALGAGDVAAVRRLMEEYARTLPVDLALQGFAAEAADLAGAYAPPGGLLLARAEGAPVGCLGFRPFGAAGACEIKRLFVRPAARGGTGRLLMEAAIAAAAAAGFHTMLLDSLPTMSAAIALYRSLGFERVPPYWDNPFDGALYFGRRIAAARAS